MKIYVINGPNLNMLGIREPDKYGTTDYKALLSMISEYASEKNIEVVFYQSNHEGDLVDKIQEAYFEGAAGIVINPGAYTHTSIALLDAVRSTMLPTVEIHISNVKEREDYRQISYIREAAVDTVMGLGVKGYLVAIDKLLDYLSRK
ncbi:MAG: type II 3-dehydroquinate dehydratase [Clostridia bacterium]|nr:type II 3-dehydroquinate dehydratase [Clostridia bacterium]